MKEVALAVGMFIIVLMTVLVIRHIDKEQTNADQ